MKRFLAWMMILLMVASMAGCADSADGVKLKSERDVIRYAAKNFGKATVVKSEENTQSNRITYTMKDKEHGFQYEIASTATEFGLLGSHSGKYFETTTDTFRENYYDFIISQFDSQQILLEKGLLEGKYVMLFGILCESEDTAEKEGKKFVKKVNKIDKRGYFADGCIGIYNSDQEFIGICSLEDATLETGSAAAMYDFEIQQMMYKFAVVVHKTTNDLSGITYLYSKEIQYKDVERLNMEWLCRDDKTLEDWTTIYYFDYNGTEYFMLNDRVTIINEPGFQGTHYSQLYTSYWFTDE